MMFMILRSYFWLAGAVPSQPKKKAMMGRTALCWTIWKTRNATCFDDPARVIFHLSVVSPTGKSWFDKPKSRKHWARRVGDQEIKQVVQEIYNRSHGWGPMVPRITGG